MTRPDLRDATTDYAEGWRDGVSASVVELRAQARRIRERAVTPEDRLTCAALETAADGLLELEQAKRAPTGLHYRGG